MLSASCITRRRPAKLADGTKTSFRAWGRLSIRLVSVRGDQERRLIAPLEPSLTRSTPEINMSRPELGTGASRSSPEPKAVATNNFSAFVDKLTTESTSVLALAPAARPPLDIRLAVSDLRAAFEEPYDSGISTGARPEESSESRVLKACRWLIDYPNPLFEKMRAGDSTALPDDADTLEDLRLGSLCATKGRYSIPQRKHVKPEAISAVSRKRWYYWAARIHEFTMSPYRPELSAEATRQMSLAAEAMREAQWQPWEMYVPGK